MRSLLVGTCALFCMECILRILIEFLKFQVLMTLDIEMLFKRFLIRNNLMP